MPYTTGDKNIQQLLEALEKAEFAIEHLTDVLTVEGFPPHGNAIVFSFATEEQATCFFPQKLRAVWNPSRVYSTHVLISTPRDADILDGYCQRNGWDGSGLNDVIRDIFSAPLAQRLKHDALQQTPARQPAPTDAPASPPPPPTTPSLPTQRMTAYFGAAPFGGPDTAHVAAAAAAAAAASPSHDSRPASDRSHRSISPTLEEQAPPPSTARADAAAAAPRPSTPSLARKDPTDGHIYHQDNTQRLVLNKSGWIEACEYRLTPSDAWRKSRPQYLNRFIKLITAAGETEQHPGRYLVKPHDKYLLAAIANDFSQLTPKGVSPAAPPPPLTPAAGARPQKGTLPPPPPARRPSTQPKAAVAPAPKNDGELSKHYLTAIDKKYLALTPLLRDLCQKIQQASQGSPERSKREAEHKALTQLQTALNTIMKAATDWENNDQKTLDAVEKARQAIALLEKRHTPGLTTILNAIKDLLNRFYLWIKAAPAAQKQASGAPPASPTVITPPFTLSSAGHAKKILEQDMAAITAANRPKSGSK